MKHRRLLPLAAALTAGLLAGCGSMFQAKTDPSKFYVLTPLPADAAPTPPPLPDVAVGVFGSEFPSYLDRPQMVTRVSSNERNISEFQRWAEPLDASFGRVLTQDLGTLTGTSQIAMFPLVRVFDHEFEIFTQVYQFDGVLDGEATLRVRWRITGSGGKPNYVVRNATYTAPFVAAADPYSGYADTLSKLVGDLAKDIVAALPEARTAEAQAAAAVQAQADADKAKAAAAEKAAAAAKP